MLLWIETLITQLWFRRVKYNTGDVVWISRISGKGVMGVGSDGYVWGADR